MVAACNLWNEIKEMFEKSDRKICIYGGIENAGEQAVYLLKISEESVLANIVWHTAGICVNNRVRVLGHKGINSRGIVAYNKPNASGQPQRHGEMLIVAQDVVGGVYGQRNAIWEMHRRKEFPLMNYLILILNIKKNLDWVER